MDIDTKALKQSLEIYARQLPRGKSGEKVYAYPYGNGGTVDFDVLRDLDGSIAVQASYNLDFTEENKISRDIQMVVDSLVHEFNARNAASALVKNSLFANRSVRVVEALENEHGLEKLPMLNAPAASMNAPRKNTP